MTSKIQHCPIQLDKSTYQKIRFISKGQGIPSTDFEKKLTDALMQLCARFDTNPFHLTYEFTLYPEPQLVIKAEGQSTFQIGQVDEKELERERKEHFQEVKLSIAEINGKNVKVTEK